MSKSSSKQKIECLIPWLEWFKKQDKYKKHVKPRKQFN